MEKKKAQSFQQIEAERNKREAIKGKWWQTDREEKTGKIGGGITHTEKDSGR